MSLSYANAFVSDMQRRTRDVDTSARPTMGVEEMLDRFRNVELK